MSTFLLALFWSAIALVAVPTFIVSAQCFAALFFRDRSGVPVRPEDLKVAIVIPAHNEESSIEATIRALREEVSLSDQILVVADNCDDRTVELARGQGVDVIERNEPERRGKGYALMFAIEHLTLHPPDVVVILDADCRLQSGSFAHLVYAAHIKERPVQAEYIFLQEEPSVISSISALAALVRNQVRPRGMQVLGGPGFLAGSGMAFPWRVLQQAPALEDHLVEDLQLGTELSLLGFPPLHCAEASVFSKLPSSLASSTQQRRRWEHGHLSVLVSEVPRLVRTAFQTRRWGLIAQACDLAVPPLAMLVILESALIFIALIYAFVSYDTWPLIMLSYLIVLLALAVFAAWSRYGRARIPLRHLLMAPVYVCWKAPLYLAYLLGRREESWRRTDR